MHSLLTEKELAALLTYGQAELLTYGQAAAMLCQGKRTLERRCASGEAPKPIKIGGSVRFSRRTLLDWVDDGCPRVDGRED